MAWKVPPVWSSDDNPHLNFSHADHLDCGDFNRPRSPDIGDQAGLALLGAAAAAVDLKKKVPRRSLFFFLKRG